MNYDLAMMALDGLARSPMHVQVEKTAVVIEGDPASFKELARLCLLLGGVQTSEDTFELQSGVHVTSASLPLRLKLRAE